MQSFGVISNSLKVATSPTTHLATDLDLQKQQKYGGYNKLSKSPHTLHFGRKYHRRDTVQ